MCIFCDTTPAQPSATVALRLCWASLCIIDADAKLVKAFYHSVIVVVIFSMVMSVVVVVVVYLIYVCLSLLFSFPRYCCCRWWQIFVLAKIKDQRVEDIFGLQREEGEKEEEEEKKEEKEEEKVKEEEEVVKKSV